MMPGAGGGVRTSSPALLLYEAIEKAGSIKVVADDVAL
jgi:hypothetical protein